ncbi:MAG: mechanosensitive ion channel [Bacilli bacterium]|nr:mechanosensitive ion channel [Bacilli bacterium]
MEINKIIENPWIEKGIKVVIIILISLIIYSIISSIIKRYSKTSKFESLAGKRTTTYLRLARSITKYLFILITFLIILQILEINITSIIAGVGLLGAVFGLALQDFIKDIIRGTSILSDDYFKVGDIVKYKDFEGKVLILGLKTTKIEDIRTGNVISIANRNIDEIQVVSKYIYVNIPMPYEINVDKAEKIMDEIVINIKNLKNIDNCSYKGTNELADSSINYLIQVECNPKNKLQVRRDSIREILLTLEKNNVSVPYNQIDIHQKK